MRDSLDFQFKDFQVYSQEDLYVLPVLPAPFVHHAKHVKRVQLVPLLVQQLQTLPAPSLLLLLQHVNLKTEFIMII